MPSCPITMGPALARHRTEFEIDKEKKMTMMVLRWVIGVILLGAFVPWALAQTPTDKKIQQLDEKTKQVI